MLSFLSFSDDGDNISVWCVDSCCWISLVINLLEIITVMLYINNVVQAAIHLAIHSFVHFNIYPLDCLILVTLKVFEEHLNHHSLLFTTTFDDSYAFWLQIPKLIFYYKRSMYRLGIIHSLTRHSHKYFHQLTLFDGFDAHEYRDRYAHILFNGFCLCFDPKFQRNYLFANVFHWIGFRYLVFVCNA